MRNKWLWYGVVWALLPAASALAQKAPAQAERDKANADIAGTDAGLQTAAVQKIEGWIKGGWVSQDVWRRWVPALVKAGRQQEVLEIATLAINISPGHDGIIALQEARMRALLALGKNEEALQAAKGYYNVADIKGTAAAVEFVGLCLAKAHPEDGEIVRRFRNEQAQASQVPPIVPEKAMLKDVVINTLPYDTGLNTFKGKPKFADRVGYGYLLLVTDKGDEAEKLFRELFQMAVTQDELTQATEGIARALRAEDGHVARANAWLVKVGQSATAPATQGKPAAAAAATKDAVMP